MNPGRLVKKALNWSARTPNHSAGEASLAILKKSRQAPDEANTISF